MITAPPIHHAQNGTAAIIYREGAANSSFWKDHVDLFPSLSASAFWTRERLFVQLDDAARKAKTFKPGWDGYDAPPPNDLAVQATTQALAHLQTSSQLSPYSVLPSADGGVGISFRGSENKRAVLELLNDGTASYTLYGKEHPTESSEFLLDSDFPRILQQLMGYL